VNRLRVAGIVGAVCLTAAGCGSSSPRTASPPAGTDGGAAARPPINLVSIAATGASTVGEKVGHGAAAAVKAINAAGGVNGRLLQVTSCDEKSDANIAAKCARDAASDSKVVALVASGSTFGGQVDPILAQAQLADIGTLPFSEADFASPALFLTGAGGLAGTGGAASILATDGAKKINIAFQDVPAGRGLEALTNVALAPFSLTVSKAVGIPPTAADLSPQVAQLISNNPDGIVVGTTKDLAVKIIAAARQQGYTKPITVPSASIIGGTTNVKFVGGFSHGGPGYDQFTAEMRKSDPSAPLDEDALSAWLSVHLFADTAKSLQTVTRATVWSAMNKVTSYDTKGLTPPLDFTQAQAGGGGHFARVINPSVVELTYDNGSLKNVSNPAKFVNIFTGKVQ